MKMLILLNFFVTSVLAQVELQPLRNYKTVINLQDKSKKTVPVIEFGKVKGQEINIVSIGEGAVSLEFVEKIKEGRWLPKNKKGMWYLKEVRLTCPPLRALNDQRFKFYAPSSKEVEAGADLEYKLDVPCMMWDQEKIDKKLVEVANLMQTPFDGEKLKCDAKKMSAECKEIETVTKILSSDFNTGKSSYCDIELNVGNTWEIPTQLEALQSKQSLSLQEDVESLTSFISASIDHEEGAEISESQLSERLVNRQKLVALESSLLKFHQDMFQNFDEKTLYMHLTLKNGGNYQETLKIYQLECSKEGDPSACVDRKWLKNHNLEFPLKMMTAYGRLKLSKNILKNRAEKELKSNQTSVWENDKEVVKELKEGCRFDNDVVVIVCPDKPKVENP